MHRALRLFRVGIAVALVMVATPALAAEGAGHAKPAAKSTKHAAKAPKAKSTGKKGSHAAKSSGKQGGKHAATHTKSSGKKAPKKSSAK